MTMRKTKSQDSSPFNQEEALKYKSIYPLYLTKVPSLHRHSMVLIYNSKIKSFTDVEIKNDCSFIDLSLNRITDFTNFPSTLSDLTALILDSNQIESFNGMQLNSFPKLRFLSLKQNPISKNIYFKLMCLIVFGSQLYSINGEKVNDILRQNANKLRKLLFPYLIQGKIIINLDPLRFKETSPKNEIYKTTPYRKKIEIKSRGAFSSPIHYYDLAPKKSVQNREIIEMINDNDIVASPSNYLNRKKFVVENEKKVPKIKTSKNSQKTKEEAKNDNNQAEEKYTKRKFVEKNKQNTKNEPKKVKSINVHSQEKNVNKKFLLKSENDAKKEQKVTQNDEIDESKQINNREQKAVQVGDDDQIEEKVDQNQQEVEVEEEEEESPFEPAIDQAEDKNESNEQKIIANDENEHFTLYSIGDQKEENDECEVLIQDKEVNIIDQNQQEEEEEEFEEEEEESPFEPSIDQAEDKNESNEQKIANEATELENKKEHFTSNFISDQKEENEIKQKQGKNQPNQGTDKSDSKSYSIENMHFSLERPMPLFDPNGWNSLQIDKNLTVENEQEKDQDDSRFDIDHLYTFRTNNDTVKFTFGIVDE